jgi:hypothetical protein
MIKFMLPPSQGFLRAIVASRARQRLPRRSFAWTALSLAKNSQNGPHLGRRSSGLSRLSYSTQSSTAAAKSLIITPNAIQQLKQIDKNPILRVAVDSGGCNGFQYVLELVQEVDPEDMYATF